MKKIFLICEWITESTPTLLAAFGKSAIEQLKMLAEKPVAANLGPSQQFLNASKIDWYVEGL